MKTAHLVRHGNCKYFEGDRLTGLGYRQVDGLIDILEPRLPEGRYVLVSSSSGRAMQTAEEIKPLLEAKSGNEIEIMHEPMLHQLRCIGDVDTVIARGKKNFHLIERYSGMGEHGVFVGHKELLIPMGNAISQEFGIELPEHLRIKEYEESYVKLAIDEFNLSREEAIEKVKEMGPVPVKKIPPMAEASALFFDLENNSFEYITPGPWK